MGNEQLGDAPQVDSRDRRRGNLHRAYQSGWYPWPRNLGSAAAGRSGSSPRINSLLADYPVATRSRSLSAYNGVRP